MCGLPWDGVWGGGAMKPAGPVVFEREVLDRLAFDAPVVCRGFGLGFFIMELLSVH